MIMSAWAFSLSALTFFLSSLPSHTQVTHALIHTHSTHIETLSLWLLVKNAPPLLSKLLMLRSLNGLNHLDKSKVLGAFLSTYNKRILNDHSLSLDYIPAPYIRRRLLEKPFSTALACTPLFGGISNTPSVSLPVFASLLSLIAYADADALKLSHPSYKTSNSTTLVVSRADFFEHWFQHEKCLIKDLGEGEDDADSDK